MTPLTWGDILGNTLAVGETRKWCSAHQAPLMLCGPPGTGKTAMVRLITNTLGRNVIEMSNSDEKKVTKRDIIEALQCTTRLSIDGKLGILVLEDVGSMVSDLSAAMADIAKKRNKSKSKSQSQFKPATQEVIVCTCDDYTSTSSLRTFAKKCKVVRTCLGSSKDITHMIQRVSTLTNTRFTGADVRHIVESAGGDFRQAIHVMELVGKTGGDTMTNTNTIVGSRKRDIVPSEGEGMGLLLGHNMGSLSSRPSIPELEALVIQDRYKRTSFIHSQSIKMACPLDLDYSTMADALSLVDVLSETGGWQEADAVLGVSARACLLSQIPPHHCPRGAPFLNFSDPSILTCKSKTKEMKLALRKELGRLHWSALDLHAVKPLLERYIEDQTLQEILCTVDDSDVPPNLSKFIDLKRCQKHKKRNTGNDGGKAKRIKSN